jgi:serine/threonine-protein kinase
MIGSLIQNYKIYSVLGEGGMGIVYKAFDVKLERYVALKILNNAAVKQSQFVERFRREAKNQAKLNHPNIVPVYEFTEDKDVMGIAMEYVEGESLEQMINRVGRLELIEALGLLQQILVGISYAHNKGFIHRDIKPSNVIINREGVAKIMDFGISKAINEISITKTGAKVGTIMYMSPEQVRAEEPTIQSDIYAIGITFYEMLSGKPPFDYKSEFEILEAHLKKIPQKITLIRQDLPPEVDIILAKALDKNMLKRYFNCEEFLDDVNKLIKIVLSAGKRSGDVRIKQRKKQINWKFYLIVIVSFILFVVFGAIGYHLVSKVWDKKFNNSDNRDTSSKDYPGYNNSPNYTGSSEWSKLNSQTEQNLNAVYFVDDSLGYACGDTGTVIKTTNGGALWSPVQVPAYKRNIKDIIFTRDGRGFMIGTGGLFLTCDYNGAPWTPKDSAKIFYNPANMPRFFKFIVVNNSIFLLAYNGCIFRSKNNGYTWENIQTTEYQFLNMTFTDENNGYVIGRGGLILNTSDAGDSWKMLDQFSDAHFKDIDFAGSEFGFVIGGDKIFATVNAGQSWIQKTNNKSNALSKIKHLGNTIWLIACEDGKILLSNDNGENWESKNLPAATRFQSIFSKNKSVYVAGSGGIILKWNRM